MKKTSTWIALFLAFSALFLWVIGPAMSENLGASTTNGLYMMLRVITGVGLGFALRHFCRNSRPQVLFLVAFACFVDQVILKLIWVISDQKFHPESWVQAPPMRDFAVQLGVSFIFLAPILLVLGFLGHELSEFLNACASRSRPTS